MNKYQAFTVSIKDGSTYWQNKTGSINEVINHAKKFTKRKADLIIYNITDPNNCVFIKHISHKELNNE